MNLYSKNLAIVSLLIILTLILPGCSSSGIRALTEQEDQYFLALKKELKKSNEKITELMNRDHKVNEEKALKEVSRLDSDIERSKTIYSIREVLQAPKGNRAEFVQVTRNKIILFYLAEAARARNDKLNAEFLLANARRQELISTHSELTGLVEKSIESNKVLYNHINKSTSRQLSDVLAEVGRQVSAFNENIKEGDENNPVIKGLIDNGKSAEKQLKKSEQGLTQFLDVWNKLNKQ